MRKKEQILKEKELLNTLKKIDIKLKKEEKEERNLQRLINNDLEQMKDINYQKKVSGVTLLSNRFQTKLPVSEKMQMQIQAALQGMKIKPSELHFSEKVLDEFEQLRESLLVLFSLDKYITDRQEEHGLIQENNTELNALKVVYDKSVQL